MANFDFFGDYHTHTTFSHGKGSVRDNVAVAHAKGLKEIAITDHGLRHVIFGLRQRKLPELRAQIDEAMQEFPDVHVILGVEANLCGRRGNVDVRDDQKELFELIIGGYHKAVYMKRISEYFTLHANSVYEKLTGKPTQKMIARNTDAIIKAVEKFPLAVLTHIGYGLSVEPVPVAECCAEYGTLLELNGKRINMTDKQFEQVLKTKVEFIVNSDAHLPENVGNFTLGASYVERYGIVDRVANVGKRPGFRK